MNWVLILLPLAIDIIKKYIESTSTLSDDKILDLVQTGASYLAKGGTTSVSNTDAKLLAQRKYFK